MPMPDAGILTTLKGYQNCWMLNVDFPTRPDRVFYVLFDLQFAYSKIILFTLILTILHSSIFNILTKADLQFITLNWWKANLNYARQLIRIVSGLDRLHTFIIIIISFFLFLFNKSPIIIFMLLKIMLELKIKPESNACLPIRIYFGCWI